MLLSLKTTCIPLKLKGLTIPSVGKDVKQLEHIHVEYSHTWMVQPYMNDTDTLENWKYLLKIYRYIEISYEPSILLIVIYPRERKAYVNQRLGTRICLATLPIIPQKLETSNVHQWNNGSIVLYLHIGISRSNEKEWTTAMYNILGESKC